MPASGQQTIVSRWFQRLGTLQNCAAINASVPAMDLLTFANTNIVSVLPSDNEQGQFRLNCRNRLGFDVAPGDLTSFPTFRGLLDHFTPLAPKVEDYLQTLAAAPFPGGSPVDFDKAFVAAAFPGGSGGAAWLAANSSLQGVFPAVCFTEPQQTKVAQVVDDAAKKIPDLVSQIAALG